MDHPDHAGVVCDALVSSWQLGTPAARVRGRAVRAGVRRGCAARSLIDETTTHEHVASEMMSPATRPAARWPWVMGLESSRPPRLGAIED